MGMHAYCVLPQGCRPPHGLAGVAGAAVRAVHAGPLACWVSAHDDRPGADTVGVTAHNAVVQAALDCAGTPVPLRFGHWFDDADAVAAAIAQDAARWTAMLHRIDGCIEYAVHIAPIEGAQAARDVHAAAAHTGSEYMAALAQRHAGAAERRRREETLCAWILEQAGALVRESRTERPAAAGAFASMAHLVQRRDAEEYERMMQHAREARADLRIVVSGPWPPYSFVS
jgi:hypothetical protein